MPCARNNGTCFIIITPRSWVSELIKQVKVLFTTVLSKLLSFQRTVRYVVAIKTNHLDIANGSGVIYLEIIVFIVD